MFILILGSVNMRNFYRKPKKYRWIALFLLLTFSIAAPFLVSFIYIPQEIHLLVGKEHSFAFRLPLHANIKPDKEGVLKLNHQAVKDNISLSLRDPFSIESTELGSLDVELKLFGFIPLKNMKVDIIPNLQVVPCGRTVGVKISTDGIMVLGTGYVNGTDGKTHEPSKGFLQSGDLIMEMNGRRILTKEELISHIEEHKEGMILFKIKRESEMVDISLNPVKSVEDQKNKLGIWVRDNTQGIGTITYYNPETMHYGALGHGILDVDTRQLMSIREGKIMESEITSIKKGKRGTPGELSGAILDETPIGTIQINSPYGIYGKIDPKQQQHFPHTPISIALQHEIHEGAAVIRSNVQGRKIEEYDIYIQSVNRFSHDSSKGMVIKITDSRLLNRTNGIVQGMSGSPIIQDGKLIGAVTHVFVQEPSKGYGIFIENMLKQENLLVNTGN